MLPFKVTLSAQIAHGELAGVATATQLPDVAGLTYVRIKAGSTNTGTVWIGSSNAVTAGAGTTTTTAGFPLTAGQSETFFVDNLNLLWRICTGTGDECSYFAYKG